MPQRVGVMGGTFDPVHIGHLRAAEEATEMLGLDTLLFIPAATPPHKSDTRILAFEHRRRMLELAIDGHPRFRISDIEHRLPGKSYTVITLRTLRQELAEGTELFFLIGMDACLELDSWWHYRELFELAHLVVMQRPGFQAKDVEAVLREKVSSRYAHDGAAGTFSHPELLSVHAIENTPMGVSSTRIRELVASGRSIRYLVLPEVVRYIVTNNLYQAQSLEPPE